MRDRHRSDTGLRRARRESHPRRAALRAAGARWRVAASGTAAITQQRRRDTGRWAHENDRSQTRWMRERDPKRPHVRKQTNIQATRMLHDAPTTHTQETTTTGKHKHMGEMPSNITKQQESSARPSDPVPCQLPSCNKGAGPQQQCARAPCRRTRVGGRHPHRPSESWVRIEWSRHRGASTQDNAKVCKKTSSHHWTRKGGSVKGGGGVGEERGRENSIDPRPAPTGGSRLSGDDPTEQRQGSSTRSHQTYLEHHDGCTTSHKRSSRGKHGARGQGGALPTMAAVVGPIARTSAARSCSISLRHATSAGQVSISICYESDQLCRGSNVSQVRRISLSNQSIFTITCQPGSFYSILDTRAAQARPPSLAIQGGGGRRDGDASAILLHAAPAHSAPASTRTRRLHGRRSARAGARRRRLPPIGHPPSHRAPTRPRPALSARATTVVVCRPAPPPPISLFLAPPRSSSCCPLAVVAVAPALQRLPRRRRRRHLP